ncbi:UV excision repair protein RAD23 homolog B-like [Perognathus longimembris pacificus]|uniref:UV excision repair protein RAD23 homolog B-like n=1 Tax=Perognathus longimembris pacificus TaxID=214514 RepID=UPI0020184ED1|nr:UV excision repair protein RAD23 homolog B-like [Perognathus longimembris pacificus]
MRVTVKTLKWETFRVDVDPEGTVRDLKEKIAAERGGGAFPAAAQKLIYAGRDGVTITVGTGCASTTQPGPRDHSDSSTQPGPRDHSDSSTQPGPRDHSDSSTQPGPRDHSDSSTQLGPRAAASSPASTGGAQAAAPTAAPASAAPARRREKPAVQPAGTAGARSPAPTRGAAGDPPLPSLLEAALRRLELAIGQTFENMEPEGASVGWAGERAVVAPRAGFHPDGAAGGPPPAGRPGPPAASAGPRGRPVQRPPTRPLLQQMQRRFQQEASLLQALLQQPGPEDPPSAQRLGQPRGPFTRTPREPAQEAAGRTGRTGSGAGRPSRPQPAPEEEAAAVHRLRALGVPRRLAMQAHLACEKNEDLAADLLLQENLDED